jgi:hypothetical protein
MNSPDGVALAEDRFRLARPAIESRPCLKPLRPVVWVTTETLSRDPAKRWQDMGYGVFCLVGE